MAKAEILDEGVADPTDVRFARSQARLHEAVLELAAERDITTASVSELARRAGVNRTTFYAHAQTPMELLARVLSQDLDKVRQRTMAQLSQETQLLRGVTRTTLREIVGHVRKHEAVYASPNRFSSRYALRVVLAEHVEHSVLIVLREGYVRPPNPAPEMHALYAAFIAHGVAGAVENWLAFPRPLDDDILMSAVEAMYPDWYAPEFDR